MENLKQNAMMEEAIASAEISMDTPDTEWASVDRYSVETGLLKRFFKLYEEGRKTGDPQNFIDYFKAEHYLLTEVGKAITSRDTYWKERVRKNVGVYANKKFMEGTIVDPLELYEAITNEDNLK